MAITYSCPNCGRILGGDTDVIAPSCPDCGTRFDAEQLRRNRRRDRWMHILVLTGCAGVGGAAVMMIAVSQLSPDSPRMGAFIVLGLLLGTVGGFLALKRYDAARNGPL